MPIKVEFVGVKRITMKFLDTMGITKAIDAGVKTDVVKLVTERLAGEKNYPPAPTSANYTRTYKLGNSWTSKQQGWMSYAIENATSYAMFVVGDANGNGQAWMHVRRWWLASALIAGAMPKFRASIRQKLTDFLNG